METIEQAELLAVHVKNYLEREHQSPFQMAMILLYAEVIRLRKEKEK
jgi:hypothetical protein